jgi:hypothetical protein
MAIDLEAAFLFKEAADQMTNDHGDGKAFTTRQVIELIETRAFKPEGDLFLKVHGITIRATTGLRVARRARAPKPVP